MFDQWLTTAGLWISNGRYYDWLITSWEIDHLLGLYGIDPDRKNIYKQDSLWMENIESNFI